MGQPAESSRTTHSEFNVSPIEYTARLATAHTLGNHLRFTREANGLTVDEVSRQTKIRTRYITAIETDDHDSLSQRRVRGRLCQNLRRDFAS